MREFRGIRETKPVGYLDKTASGWSGVGRCQHHGSGRRGEVREGHTVARLAKRALVAATLRRARAVIADVKPRLAAFRRQAEALQASRSMPEPSRSRRVR
jgi:hypothetical protein